MVHMSATQGCTYGSHAHIRMWSAVQKQLISLFPRPKDDMYVHPNCSNLYLCVDNREIHQVKKTANANSTIYIVYVFIYVILNNPYWSR